MLSLSRGRSSRSLADGLALAESAGLDLGTVVTALETSQAEFGD